MKHVMIFLPILLWFAFIYYRANQDAEKEKKGDNIIHWLNFLIALTACAVLIVGFQIFESQRYVGFIIWAGLWYSWLFNDWFNRKAGNPKGHLGKNWFDRQEAKIGYVMATRIKVSFGLMCLAGYIVSSYVALH